MNMKSDHKMTDKFKDIHTDRKKKATERWTDNWMKRIDRYK